jgi:hypothetical protein
MNQEKSIKGVYNKVTMLNERTHIVLGGIINHNANTDRSTWGDKFQTAAYDQDEFSSQDIVVFPPIPMIFTFVTFHDISASSLAKRADQQIYRMSQYKRHY